MNPLVENLENAKNTLVNTVMSGDSRRMYTPEIDFRPVLQCYGNREGLYNGKITKNLLVLVCNQIQMLKINSYVKKILFRTPVNAEIYYKEFNSNFTCELDYANILPQYYSLCYVNDNKTFSSDLWENKFREKVNSEIEYRLNVKDAEIAGLEERLEHFDSIVDRCSGLEAECKKIVEENVLLKSENLDLNTRHTATTVANSCLNNDIELDNSRIRENQLEMIIEDLERSLEKKSLEIKTLKNKLEFVRGQKDMIREVLDGGTLVVHREASGEKR